MIPDVVYVPTKWSLRFYIPRYTKSHVTHVVYDFEYIGTLPLSYMFLTLLRLTTKKNYKSDSSVMKSVGPYRNNKKRSHTQLDSRKQVIAFQDRVITINIKEAQHPLK